MSLKLHIDNWILKSEPDYYTMFIKAWIPFNAWYFNEYNTKKDKEALDQIKNSKNKIRNRIESLLTTNDDELSRNFRFRLACLHQELANRSLMNYGTIINFTSIVIDGILPTPITEIDGKGNIYKAIPDKTAGYRAVIVDRATKSLMDRTFNPYDYNAFLIDNQFISLKDKRVKEKIKSCFERINPKRPINLISPRTKKTDFIELDKVKGIKFVNDSELIAKAIVQILYSLRCVLFHGDVDPNITNQAIYEHAFFILLPLIKELK